MTKFTRRTYLRHYLKVPIEFRGCDQDEGQRALVFNCCRGGMNFISDDYVEPGTIIFVRSSEPLNAYIHARGETGGRARVVWCRRCSEDDRPRFSIGVEFTPSEARDHQTDH